ncbi:3-hydroxyacyl-CoA dehydrogenase [Afifella pfennigii]|uniref:3-hydroxyacyl-CoA dehydrogenase n=1 Tax=Afifella pfennigii TaxID=209897 RepID=UPI00069087C7|nr:3-hydroxyacyl-CoA dehydrogenase [Afifella pfennigii]
MSVIDAHDPNLVVGVIGAGTMGRGIAQVCASAGIATRLFDTDPAALAGAQEFVGKMLDRAVEKGRISGEAAEAAKANIRPAKKLEELADCGVVIEAVVEKIAIKEEIFAALDGILRKGAILATNTSSLSVTQIGAATKRPESVAGFHFFNPPPLMKLVEVIRGLKTSEACVEALLALAERIGKHPVACADTPGFVVNHAGRAYMPEGLRIVFEGIAAPAAIDRIMKEAAGFRLGPFELLDLVGLDVAHSVMQAIYEQYYHEPAYRPSPLSDTRLAAGLLGRKSKQGFYDYRDGAEAPSEAEAPPAPADVRVWVPPREAEARRKLQPILAAAGASLESGEAPSAEALVLVAPMGEDVSSCVAAQKLPAARTLGIDLLLALDTRRVLMASPATTAEARRAARGLFAADGAKVSLIEDSPGFVAQRILAMVVNVACHIAQQGIAAPQDIDTAVKLGLNYPLGPLEWGDQLGPQRVLTILENLQKAYGEPRYRPSPWLRRRAELGLSLLARPAEG